MTHACQKDNLEIAVCKLWECHNAYCPNYAGNGVQLGITEIEWDVFGQHACRRCGAFVREFRTPEHRAGNALCWIALGVLLAVWEGGGLTGALLGGAAGVLLCLLIELGSS